MKINLDEEVKWNIENKVERAKLMWLYPSKSKLSLAHCIWVIEM